mgnify:FL=1
MSRIKQIVPETWEELKDGLNKRLASLEERSDIAITNLADRIKKLEDQTAKVEYGHTQRLRTLEANRPVDIRDSDASAIQRDLKLVSAKLERILDRLNPPF